MKSSFVNLSALVIITLISSSSSVPIQSKQSSGCDTAIGTVRSSVDAGSKDDGVHLLADLDALANGIKRSKIDSGCGNTADKKSKELPINEISVGSIENDKKETVNVIKETSVVNEDDIGKAPIVETGKAAIRSSILTNTSASQKSNANTTESQANAAKGGSSTQVESGTAENGSQANQSKSSDDLQGAAAKTFIASKNVDVSGSKRSGSTSHKAKQQESRVLKTKNPLKKSSATKVSQKIEHGSSSIEDIPSMQTGSLSKEAEKEEKATAKSTSTLLSPLNSAIKSLDSATKLLGMATSSSKASAPANKDKAITLEKTAPLSNNAAAKSSEKVSESSPSIEKVTGEQKAEMKPLNTNVTTPDVRSSASASSNSKQASTASNAKPVKAVDPYAEIAVGPDAPKIPDLKTGSEKAGLPVMKVDPSGSPPEQVSFDKGETPEPPKALPARSSSRAGPQDVGGILDQLTDRLNKGGVAPENPLPPTESKAITDRLTEYDHEALDQAKGWEATGLKAIEKLKSAEFAHGNMKTELSKELTDRLAGGYGAELEGNNFAGAGSEVGNLEAPAQTSYAQPEYSRQQHTTQWPEFNSVESLDSEAQREEQSYSQYPAERGGNYGGGGGGGGGGEAMMNGDQNSYDRQDIPSFFNQGVARDSMEGGQGQEYYKRSLILKPYYYNNVPYGFRHPYDD